MRLGACTGWILLAAMAVAASGLAGALDRGALQRSSATAVQPRLRFD